MISYRQSSSRRAINAVGIMTNKKQNYAIIGGQYVAYDYGTATTLLGAKRIAGKHAEYWDNRQGWHRPRIYAIKDVERTHNFYGDILAPKGNAQPVAIYDHENHKWVTLV